VGEGEPEEEAAEGPGQLAEYLLGDEGGAWLWLLASLLVK